MTKVISIITIATLGSIAFASTAFAGDTVDRKIKQLPVEASSLIQATETRTIARRTDMESNVRSAVERGELVAVQSVDGRVFYNRTIPVSELPDPELNIRVLEKFDVEHNGQVFTNKIVEKLN